MSSVDCFLAYIAYKNHCTYMKSDYVPFADFKEFMDAWQEDDQGWDE